MRLLHNGKHICVNEDDSSNGLSGDTQSHRAVKV